MTPTPGPPPAGSPRPGDRAAAPPRGAARPRVASLLPSATEIVCALGCRDDLVGVSHECDFPPGLGGLPVLTAPKLSLSMESGAIDRDVRRVLRDALAVYDLDLEALARADPDVIVTQDLCDVCAVSLRDVRAAVEAVLRPGVRVVNLAPTRLDDVLGDVVTVGAALGRQDRAAALAADLRARLDALGRRTAALPDRPATLTLEWIDPPMVGGTWMPELVELAGGRPLVTRPGQHAPTLRRHELAALDPAPEAVLVKPCGFDLARTAREVETLEDLLEGLPWPALAHGRVWVADGSAYFNRPGPRLVDSAEILAACLHPQACADLAERHAGGFVRLDGLRAAAAAR